MPRGPAIAGDGRQSEVPAQQVGHSLATFRLQKVKLGGPASTAGGPPEGAPTSGSVSQLSFQARAQMPRIERVHCVDVGVLWRRGAPHH